MYRKDKIKKCIQESKVPRSQMVFDLYQMGLKVSGQAISNWEAGISVPRIDKLIVLAKYFGKPITYFLEKKTTRGK